MRTDLVTGIQHLGIPTKDVEKTVGFYKSLGFTVEWSADTKEFNVVFLRLKDIVIETYKAEACGKTGAVDHIAINVTDVDSIFSDLKSSGYKLLDCEVNFLPFLKKGVKFFTIEGPNAEKIEFNQILE